MNVNFRLVNAAYDIAGLSTCVLKEYDENSDCQYQYGSDEIVSITENLSVVAKYEFLESDQFTPLIVGPYECHNFTVTFIRDGKIVDSISFSKRLKEKKFGSLASPELADSLKMALLNDFSPNVISKFKLMRNKTGLTKDEIEAIVSKSNELKLQTQKSKSR